MRGSARPVVLVVDDEPAVADTYAHGLEDRYETRVAYGGQAALEALDDDVDVLLLDRRMPDLSGDEVLEEVRARGYDCVVVMTTAVDPDLNILEMDFDDYLSKPIAIDTLVETVDGHVRSAAEHNPELQEYLSTVSKLSVLEESRSRAELRESDEYQRLRDRAATLAADLEDEVEGFEEIVSTHRDVDRGS